MSNEARLRDLVHAARHKPDGSEASCGDIAAALASSPTPEPEAVAALEAEIRAWHGSSEPARSFAERLAVRGDGRISQTQLQTSPGAGLREALVELARFALDYFLPFIETPFEGADAQKRIDERLAASRSMQPLIERLAAAQMEEDSDHE